MKPPAGVVVTTAVFFALVGVGSGFAWSGRGRHAAAWTSPSRRFADERERATTPTTTPQDVIVQLVEEGDDPASSHRIVAPHVAMLLSSNVTAAALKLEEELDEAGYLPRPEGPAAIAAATDYIVNWLEAFTQQTASTAEQSQELLKDLMVAAKRSSAENNPLGGGDEYDADFEPRNRQEAFDDFLADNTHRISGSFLVFLGLEIKRLKVMANRGRGYMGSSSSSSDDQQQGVAPLLAVLEVIAERVRLHLQTLTEQDALHLAKALADWAAIDDGTSGAGGAETGEAEGAAAATAVVVDSSEVRSSGEAAKGAVVARLLEDTGAATTAAGRARVLALMAVLDSEDEQSEDGEGGGGGEGGAAGAVRSQEGGKKKGTGEAVEKEKDDKRALREIRAALRAELLSSSSSSSSSDNDARAAESGSPGGGEAMKFE